MPVAEPQAHGAEGVGGMTRRANSAYHCEPKGAPTTAKVCLGCGEAFDSVGAGHRMCKDCRSPRDYLPRERRKKRYGVGVEERDAICREVLGMKPKPQRFWDTWF